VRNDIVQLSCDPLALITHRLVLDQFLLSSQLLTLLPQASGQPTEDVRGHDERSHEGDVRPVVFTSIDHDIKGRHADAHQHQAHHALQIVDIARVAERDEHQDGDRNTGFIHCRSHRVHRDHGCQRYRRRNDRIHPPPQQRTERDQLSGHPYRPADGS
jgi:hypothetical protein